MTSTSLRIEENTLGRIKAFREEGESLDKTVNRILDDKLKPSIPVIPDSILPSIELNSEIDRLQEELESMRFELSSIKSERDIARNGLEQVKEYINTQSTEHNTSIEALQNKNKDLINLLRIEEERNSILKPKTNKQSCPEENIGVLEAIKLIISRKKGE